MKNIALPAVKSSQLLLLLLCLIALYVVVPQLGDFKSSWNILRQPDKSWVAAAIGAAVLTYLFAAFNYFVLAFKPLSYRTLVLVQLAAMFVNRILPGGLGALGTNYVYLARRQHTAAQASSVLVANNSLGFLGHGVLFLAVFVIWPGPADLPGGTNINFAKLLYPGLLIALGAGVLAISPWRRKLSKLAGGVLKQLAAYKRRMSNLVLALLSSCGLTFANILALYCCAQALNIDLNFAQTLLVFTLGVGLATVTPTPGGLGGFEAGLAAGYIAYGIDASPALAVALLYRFITYWLAIIAGALALIAVRRLGYI